MIRYLKERSEAFGVLNLGEMAGPSIPIPVVDGRGRGRGTATTTEVAFRSDALKLNETDCGWDWVELLWNRDWDWGGSELGTGDATRRRRHHHHLQSQTLNNKSTINEMKNKDRTCCASFLLQVISLLFCLC